MYFVKTFVYFVVRFFFQHQEHKGYTKGHKGIEKRSLTYWFIREGGRWKMEGGRWKVEDGRWKMEGGRWKVEGGRWKVEGKKTLFLPHFSNKTTSVATD